MGMATFFPWFQITERVAVPPYELLPFSRNDREPFQDALSIQSAFEDVLGDYFVYENASVQTATILKYQDADPLADLSEERIQAAFAFAELVSLVGLSDREFFFLMPSLVYSNRDNYRFVVQGYSGPRLPISVRTRRRDGHTDTTVMRNAFRAKIPEHVTHYKAKLNSRFLSALQAGISENEDNHLLESIMNFNMANTDRSDFSEHLEIVLTVSAMERLVESAGNELQFRKRLGECLAPAITVPLVTSRRLNSAPVKRREEKSESLLDAWAKDLFRVRNDNAHGRIEHRYPSIWSVKEHLLLSSIIYPLAVKQRLQNMGLYELSDKERAEIDTIEIALDSNLFARDEDGNHDRRPWEELRIEQFKRECACRRERGLA